MIERILHFSIRQRWLILAATLGMAALGAYNFQKLPIDAVPDVTNVQVQVLTNSPGLAPEEVERFITFPVETAMSGLPRIEQIRSVSKFGLSVVTVVFEEGTDIYWARQLVGERVVAARGAIPRGAGEPGKGGFLLLDSPVLLNGEFDALRERLGDDAAEIDCTFAPEDGENALRLALNRICKEAEDLVRGGAVHLILSDRNVGPARAPVVTGARRP